MSSPVLDIRYVPSALPDANAVLAYLIEHVEWDRRMRARRTASFGLPYDYSGQRYDAVPMPSEIAAVAEVASRLAGHPFDNCLANLYETGASTMGFHHDSYDGLVPTSAIAIASFGATRTLVFASRDRAHRREFPLEHGSILLMTRATQEAWVHALPREEHAALRISLTFRHMTAGATSGPA